MAYSCYLASVPTDRVLEIRTPQDVSRVSSRVVWVSHYISPASKEITEAMDGGDELDTDTWHPLRGFMTHHQDDVGRILDDLEALVQKMKSPKHPLHSDDFVAEHLAKVVELFQHARSSGESIVTLLDLSRPKRQGE